MTFAGVSLVGGDGKLCASTVSPIDCGAASGYHFLVVEGFSRTRDILPAGEYIRCRTFLVGGHRWYLDYYPNGCDSEHAGFVSLGLFLEEDDDDDWEANEDDQTDNDDEDEDGDYEDEDKDEYHQDEHTDNDDAQDDHMVDDDDDGGDDDYEDKEHEDEHYGNDEAHADHDMAEDDDHDYHELVPSVKAQVSLCFIDQFQWLN
ncbi:Speckle-type POZ protein-like protein B [Hordeum vulgare]|nr:Speckle-type POZ protein-like protein B [Hordeum vulgare]